MRFDELGLAPELLRAIADIGYTEATPIQQQAIPLVMAGQDIMGGAQTGTGKTAAFTLPLLQRLLPLASSSSSPARHPVRALILAPTRELAIQVHDNLATYGKHTPFRTLCVYGGVDIRPQIEEIRKGVEFLVATPGRLLDLVEQKCLNFQSVQALVLDEADRMLDMGFIPDVTRILNLLPKERQSLLFSATFSEEIKKLAGTMLRDPVLVEVAKRNAVSETITHRVHPVAADAKRALLVRLLRNGDLAQALVFTRTKLETAKLARYLEKAGIGAESIHGDKSQGERMKALDAFKEGRIQALVATDVAARGIDIEELPHVINFELPHTPEDYVHRIGRTGRAGHQGNAVSLVSADEVIYLVDIEKLIKRPIEQVVVPGFEPEADYEYPPSGKKRHGRREDRSARTSPAHTPTAVTTHPPVTEGLEAATGRRTERAERSDRSERGERGDRSDGRRRDAAAGRPARSGRGARSHIAADGFDFSAPYVSHELEPCSDIPNSDKAPEHADPHKPRKMVAVLLGGLGRR